MRETNKTGCRPIGAVSGHGPTEVERTRSALCERVKASGLDLETVAERAGVRPAFLERVLGDPAQRLTFDQVLRVLRACGDVPERFFAKLYGPVKT